MDAEGEQAAGCDVDGFRIIGSKPNLPSSEQDQTASLMPRTNENIFRTGSALEQERLLFGQRPHRSPPRARAGSKPEPSQYSPSSIVPTMPKGANPPGVHW
jgi:hypothetical protein